MNSAKNFLFALLVSWLSMSLLVDVVAIPTVFQVMRLEGASLLLAGRIGGALFSKFNGLEIVLSVMTLLPGLYLWKKNLTGMKALVGITFLLIILAFSFKFYMSPQISHFAEEVARLGHDKGELYLKAFEQRTFFHGLYKKLEGVKILLLILSLVLIGMAQKKESSIFGKGNL